MKTYLELNAPSDPRTVDKRLRVEGDGDNQAVIVFEQRNALAPHNWIKMAEFPIGRDEADKIGHASGLIGFV